VGRARAALTTMIEGRHDPRALDRRPGGARRILEELDEVAAGRGQTVPTK
jgi:hypothetical protein